MKRIITKPVNKKVSNLAIIDTEQVWRDNRLDRLGAAWHGKRFGYYNRKFKDTEKALLYDTIHHEIPFSLIHRLSGDECAGLRLEMKKYQWDDDAQDLWRKAKEVETKVEDIHSGNMDAVLSILADAGLDPNTFVRKNNGTYAMKPHQLAALAMYITCEFTGNWGQMRTGKTPPTLIYMYWLLATHQIDLAVCIVPNSIKHGWYNEIPKDLPKEVLFMTDIIQGTKKKKEELWEKKSFIKIVNYAGVRTAIDKIIDTLDGQRYLVVLDEAHNVKNPDSQQTQAIKRLDPEFMVALSGTPVANKPEDIYIPLQGLAPALLGFSYAEFVRNFCKTGGYAGKDVTGYKKNGSWGKHPALEEIHLRLKTISVAAQRKDIGILYGKQIQPEELEMPANMKEVYQAVNTKIVAELLSEQGITQVKITGYLARTIRLQQVLAGYLPEMLPDGTSTGKEIWFDDKDNPKLTWLDGFIREYLDDIGKLVIFSRFIPVIKKLASRYLLQGATYICGEIKPEERIRRVDDFRTNPDTRIMICNIDIAAGMDFNPAQNAVFFERTAYLMPNSQAEDRITGINQTGDATIIPLVVAKTLDQALEYKILPKKRKYAQAVLLGGGDLSDKDMTEGLTVTKEDLFEMLGI